MGRRLKSWHWLVTAFECGVGMGRRCEVLRQLDGGVAVLAGRLVVACSAGDGIGWSASAGDGVGWGAMAWFDEGEAWVGWYPCCGRGG